MLPMRDGGGELDMLGDRDGSLCVK
eukprot:SAG22_NODE_20456_length_265_cov_1.234940_1_plen_24_part_01